MEPSKLNVLPFKPQPGIFTPPLRARLENGVTPFLADAKTAPAAVTTVELVLCAFIVEAARRAVLAIHKRIKASMAGK
jgi:hypothetical protein